MSVNGVFAAMHSLGRTAPSFLLHDAKPKRQKFTFTFTLYCHLGKTHSHRSRGDTTWKAQGVAHTHANSHAPHTITNTESDRQKGGGRGCQGGAWW